MINEFEIMAAKMARRAEHKDKKLPGDYEQDDILYCGKCHTPKQAKIEIDGAVIKPFCMCKCEAEAFDEKESKRKKKERLEKLNEIPSYSLQDHSLDYCRFENDKGFNQKVCNHAKRYVDKWNEMFEKQIGILFWGDTGIGKTFYAACIANALLDNGVPVLMTNFSRIINELSGFRIEDKNDWIRSLNYYGLLVIDDLGVERDTEFGAEIVYNVINERILSKKPLIITTNMTKDELNSATTVKLKRIYQRILEACTPIMVDGENVRTLIAKDKFKTAKGNLNET